MAADIFGVLSNKEEVYGGSRNSNDPYADYTLNQFLNVTVSTCECIDILSTTSLNTDIDIKDLINSTKDKFLSLEPGKTITSTVSFISSITDTGVIKSKLMKCPVCGKEVDSMPKMGFCSTECGLKFLKESILKMISSQKNQQNIISKKLTMIIDYINLAVNLSTILPGIVIHISTLSNTYRKLLTIMINKAFLKLKKIVNNILIWKNKLITKILKWITDGTVSQYIELLF